jgi:serine protease Do
MTIPRLSLLTLASCLTLMCGAWSSLAERPATKSEDPKASSLQTRLAVAKVLAPCFVRVQYDRGDEPVSYSNLLTRGGDSGSRRGSGPWGELITDERPFETFGILIAPSTVLSLDTMFEPRFVSNLRAEAGGKRVNATISHVARDQDAVLIELAAPIPGTTPVAFVEPAPEEPSDLFLARLVRTRGEWNVEIDSFSRSISAPADGSPPFSPIAQVGLIVDDHGRGVAARYDRRLPTDSTWRGHPKDWPWLTRDAQAKTLDQARAAADAGLLRVRLNFRSPKANPNESFGGGDEGDSITQWDGVGVAIDPTTVLVLAHLKAKATSRLIEVKVYDGSGQEHAGSFQGSLKDFGALVATIKDPLPGSISLSKSPVNAARGRLLTAANVHVHGENRVAYFGHTRLHGFRLGPKAVLYFDALMDQEAFLIDPADGLIALPIVRRPKVALQDQDRGWNPPELTPARYIAEAIASSEAGFDPSNVPLNEEEENRLAWIGVEFQPLDQELARINKVSDQTSDGRNGAIVTFVYAGSPAEKNGIKPGDIVLRLHIQGQPKPLEISVDSDRYNFMENFPWDRLDDMPAEYHDRIPAPWGSAENSFTRALTDLGTGTPYEAEVATAGVIRRVPMKVEIGPPHYGSVKRFKSEATGITARNLSYEARRYLQFAPSDPGVVVSKVEAGSKAGVAGLQIFEVVTNVNDQPVADIAEFEKAIAPGGELRLTVKRMTQGRIVKFTADPAAAK